jgi:hypothetical protein
MNEQQFGIYSSLETFIEQEIFRELCSNIFGIGVTNKIEGIDGALGTHPGLKKTGWLLALSTLTIASFIVQFSVMVSAVLPLVTWLLH